MDPNTALDEAREALARYRAAYREIENEENKAADALADAFEALDAWLSKGGFLPEDWWRK